MNKLFKLSFKIRAYHVLAIIALFFVGSCKKELYNAEKIDPIQSAKVDGYLKEPKSKFVSFASFAKSVNMSSLGNLKDVMLTGQNAPVSMMAAGKTASGKTKYKVNTDSAKLLVIDGRSNYVFTIAPVTPRAITFRNLTISKKGSTIFAFLTTYTPTRKWAKNYMLGKREKFEGRIGYTPINLNGNDILDIGQIPTIISTTNTPGQKKVQAGTTTNNYNCTVIPIYGQQAFKCKSGLHWPGEICGLTGPDRAGYIDVVQNVTFDCSGGGSEGGGGETTTTPPESYHPCDGIGNGEDENTPGENQVPGGEIDTTMCDPVTPPTPENIEAEIENKPFAFFDGVDCATLKKWLATAKFTPGQGIIDKLNTITNQIPGYTSLMVSKIQKINDAHSTVVNMDYFPVTLTQLPIVNGQRLTAGQFLHYIRTNLDSFTDGSKTFSAYNAYGVDDRNKWNSNNPLGSVVAINLPGPENGSVITSQSSTDRWTFTTIKEPFYGEHPVSGNRDFGYILNSNGSYTFYTRGVDRLTSWEGTFLQAATGIPFDEADALWVSFQNGIKDFANSHSGSANVNPTEILRPNWNLLIQVLQGKKPLSTLSKNCPD